MRNNAFTGEPDPALTHVIKFKNLQGKSHKIFVELDA